MQFSSSFKRITSFFKLLLFFSQLLRRFGLVFNLPYGLFKNAYPSMQIIWVDPQEITWHAEDLFIKGRPSVISGGDWDLKGYRISDSLRFKRVNDIIEHANNVKDSETYKEFYQGIIEGSPASRHGFVLSNEADVLNYINDVLKVYHNIKKYGYKSSSELRVDEGDVCVGVGRNGELIQLQTGHHRVAIAQIARCREIAVRVMVVHSDWWKKNRDIAVSISEIDLGRNEQK